MKVAILIWKWFNTVYTTITLKHNNHFITLGEEFRLFLNWYHVVGKRKFNFRSVRTKAVAVIEGNIRIFRSRPSNVSKPLKRYLISVRHLRHTILERNRTFFKQIFQSFCHCGKPPPPTQVWPKYPLTNESHRRI